MRPYVVILFELYIDNDLCSIDACEPLCVEDLMTQGSAEALIVAIRPRRPRIDLYGFNANLT